MPRKIKKIKSTSSEVVEKIQLRSWSSNVSKLSLKEINAEIASVRKGRKARKN